jgi:hypothetical protein
MHCFYDTRKKYQATEVGSDLPIAAKKVENGHQGHQTQNGSKDPVLGSCFKSLLHA